MTSPWTNDKEEEFVAMIEGKPELFDNTEMNFTNKTAKMNAWLELAEHFQISEKELRKRWDSLRTQYSRYTKMYASGSAEGRLCTARQQWILQRLKFLDPHIKRRSSYCTDLDYEVMVVENSCDELSPAQVDVELEADGMGGVLLPRVLPSCPDSEQNADASRLQLPKRPFQDTEKRSADSPQYPSSKRACERGGERLEPQGLQPRPSGRESAESAEAEVDSASLHARSHSPAPDAGDRWDAFGRYVASCLRGLESSRSRTQVQEELCAVLQRHAEREGQEDSGERKNRRPNACMSCQTSQQNASCCSSSRSSCRAGLQFRSQAQQDDLEPFLKSMSIVIQRLPEGARAEVKFRVHELVHRAQMKHLYEHTNTQTANPTNQVSNWENGLNYNLI